MDSTENLHLILALDHILKTNLNLIPSIRNHRLKETLFQMNFKERLKEITGEIFEETITKALPEVVFPKAEFIRKGSIEEHQIDTTQTLMIPSVTCANQRVNHSIPLVPRQVVTLEQQIHHPPHYQHQNPQLRLPSKGAFQTPPAHPQHCR